MAIAAAMGPVWEANHVWLIFLVTGLFTGVPAAFAALSTALFLPFTIALVGIILGGAAFTFQPHGYEAAGEFAPWGVAFGAASIIAPAFLGATLAAAAMGAVRSSGGQSVFAGWVSWLGADLALLAVALCAYLAATFLMVETESDPPLQADFRRRAFGAAMVSGVLALVGLVLAWRQSPLLWSELTGRGHQHKPVTPTSSQPPWADALRPSSALQEQGARRSLAPLPCRDRSAPWSGCRECQTAEIGSARHRC